MKPCPKCDYRTAKRIKFESSISCVPESGARNPKVYALTDLLAVESPCNQLSRWQGLLQSCVLFARFVKSILDAVGLCLDVRSVVSMVRGSWGLCYKSSELLPRWKQLDCGAVDCTASTLTDSDIALVRSALAEEAGAELVHEAASGATHCHRRLVVVVVAVLLLLLLLLVFVVVLLVVVLISLVVVVTVVGVVLLSPVLIQIVRIPSRLACGAHNQSSGGGEWLTGQILGAP